MGFVNRKNFLLLVILGAIYCLYYFGMHKFLTFAYISSQRDYLQQLVQAHYLHAIIWYFLMYASITAFAIPTGGLLTIVGGFLFGIVTTMLLAIVAATIGGLITFFVTRYLLGNKLEKRFPVQTKKINAELALHGHYYLLLVRLVTFVPFFLVNISAGLTQLPVWVFIWTTIVGLIPSTFIFAYAGKEFASIGSMSDLYTLDKIFLLMLIAILVSTPLILKKIRINRLNTIDL